MSDIACPVLLELAWQVGPEADLEDVLVKRAIAAGSSPGLTLARALLCADIAVREITPAALEEHGRRDKASRLRGLPPVADEQTARAAATVTGYYMDTYHAACSAAARAAAFAAATCRASNNDSADYYAADVAFYASAAGARYRNDPSRRPNSAHGAAVDTIRPAGLLRRCLEVTA